MGLPLTFGWDISRSFGCILLEMLLGYPLMEGQNEVDQFIQVCSVIGKPTVDEWPEFFNLKVSEKLMSRATNQKNNLELILKGRSKSCVDLLKSILRWSPAKRITVSQ